MTTGPDTAAHEAFARFLQEMDERLQRLEFLTDARDLDLDYAEAGLGDFETLFEALLDEAQAGDGDTTTVIVTAARYLGEVVRRTHGGEWHLPLDDPKNVHHNTPVIVGHNRSGTEFAPLFLCRAFARRRQRGAFARAIHNQIAPEKLDLSDLLAREQAKR